LIHKFRVEELEALYKELKQQSENRETILNRRNVIAFIDEGHRSQYGTMAAQMKRILSKAFFFALTGTPISKKGRDTYWEFSYPPEEKYLDRVLYHRLSTRWFHSENSVPTKTGKRSTPEKRNAGYIPHNRIRRTP
jgi:type I site-specific restriction-modification system R (restriction) subunit